MSDSYRKLDETLRELNADSVYMLLHYGWTNEARSNRWHFATRWARHLPVVLVCPEGHGFRAQEKKELRIENCGILNVAPNVGAMWADKANLHIAQILTHMEKNHVKRPLIWIYNATFAEAFASLPAVARVHHVTENYFDFPRLPPAYLERIRFITRLADLNVAVSDGCAKPLEHLVPPERLLIATNGCDFFTYGSDVLPDEEIKSRRAGYRRLAIFAGNINDRLDFDLIRRAAASSPDTLLLFVGAVALTEAAQAKFSQTLQMPNVQTFGAVHPDRLPAIYRAADLGMIPYNHDKFIVENGFPLKALEMAATGLPVVSTLMRPLLAHVPILHVTNNDDEFLAHFKVAMRDTERGEKLRALAAANDYDSRFATIVKNLQSLPRRSGVRLDALMADYPSSTTEAFKELSLRYRPPKRSFLDTIMYLFIAGMSQIVNMLPEPQRARVIQLKRRLMGGPAVEP